MGLDLNTRKNRFAATYFLNEAAMALQAQNYSDTKDDTHLARVRRNIAMALVPDADIDDAEGSLIDAISGVISGNFNDHNDAIMVSMHIVDELFKHLMPEEGK